MPHLHQDLTCNTGDELVRKCRPALRAFFQRKGASDVDELVQLTLVASLAAVERFEGRSTFKSYLFGIAQNQLLSDLRRRRSHERHERLYASSDMGPSARECEPNDPGEHFARGEEARIVTMAMRDMPPSFRQVLTMLYWDELSIDQIARTLGMPAGTVKSRLARGRSLIAARLSVRFG